MKKHLVPVLFLISSLILSSCASDSSTDANGGANNLPEGTIRVKLNGQLITYTPILNTYNPSDDLVVIHAKDPNVQIGDIRIFINNPAANKDFSVQMAEEDGKARIQLISMVNNAATATIATQGVVRVQNYSSKNISGTFNFSSSINGSGGGDGVSATDGEFNLKIGF